MEQGRQGPETIRPRAAEPAKECGLYIHWPYCARKCPYCDFPSRVGPPDEKQRQRLLKAIAAEWNLRRGELGTRRLRSIYVGGGTPSLLRSEELGALLALAGSMAPDLEITVEANPQSAGPAWLETLRDLGVNRLSLGLQSFNDDVLRFLGRAHTAQQALDCFHAARAAGFTNLSCDLILATAPSAAASLERDLDTLGRLQPEHVSAYLLSIEEETPFGRRAARGATLALGEEEARAQYLRTSEALGAMGYGHYEISSYARAGYESRHNSLYWSGAAYLGLGPGAHSFRPPEEGRQAVRCANTAQPELYLAKLEAKEAACDFAETLDRTPLRQDTLLTALRRGCGLSGEELRTRCGEAWLPSECELLSRWEARGLGRWAGKADAMGTFALNREGWLLSDSLFLDLFMLPA